jgi:O-succinylbenzoic acid--CoA ligase
LVAFAQPDPEWGQRLAIATTAVMSVDQWQEVQGKIRSELGRYAIPQDIYRIAKIPRTALGKVDREALLKSIQSENF